MKKRIIFLLILFFGFFGVTSCDSHEGENDGPVVTDIEISANPKKLEYYEGENFDTTGLVVKKVLDNNYKIVVTDFTIDKTSELVTTDDKVTVTWGDFSKTIDITVNPVPVYQTLKDIEIKITKNYKYTITNDINNNIQYRNVYNDDSTGEWISVTADDIKGVTFNGDKLNVKLEFIVLNQKIEKTVELTINTVTPIDVSTIYTKTPDPYQTYYLHGKVAALACTMKSASAGEYFIKDMNTNDMIAVSGLCAKDDSSALYQYRENVKFNIGDEVVLPVTFNKVGLTASSDYNKPICEYKGGDFVKTAIISTGNAVNFSHDNVPVIASQSELQSFLSSSNRLDNYYKLVKLSGDLHYVVYGSSGQYRFFFDNSIMSNDEQKCSGSSPVFMECNSYYSTGKKFSDLVFGEINQTLSNDDYYNKLHSSKDIYCFLAGGNLYYHEFAILNENDVTDPTPVCVSTKFVAPTNKEYIKGQDLDLTGGKIVNTYNYSQYNEEIPLTSDMITSSTVNKNEAGKYVVTFKYNDLSYNFNVEYFDEAPISIEVLTAPNKTTYTHRQGINDIVLTGGKLKVTYSNSVEEINITKDMLQKEESPDWKVGTVNYTLKYHTKTCLLPITFENTAVSIEEFYSDSCNVGEEYDVHAIVAGATSSFQQAELLLMSTTSSKLLGVKSLSQLVGAYNAVSLDTSRINVGDEIIIRIKKVENSDDAAGQIVGQGVGSKTYDSILVLSHGNTFTYDLVGATVIDSHDDFKAFCADEDRFYSIVKLVDVKAVMGAGRLRLEYQEFADKTAQSADFKGYSPCIIQAGCQNIDIYQYWTGLNKGKTEDYTSVGNSNYDVYALYITTYANSSGPVSHTFVIMDESWFVQAR